MQHHHRIEVLSISDFCPNHLEWIAPNIEFYKMKKEPIFETSTKINLTNGVGRDEVRASGQKRRRRPIRDRGACLSDQNR